MPRAATGLNTVARKRRDGAKEYTWYHRSSGLLIGRSRDGWTKEAAIARAREIDNEASRGAAAPGSFGELCKLYLGSPKFKRLSAKTQRGYRQHIEVMRECWQAVPARQITKAAVRALHQQYEDSPWQANAIVRTLRLIMNYGIKQLELAGLGRNPAEGLELYKTAARTQVWDQAKINAFLEAAEPRLRLAFALLLYSVQRPSDMLRLSRPMMFERDGRTWIRLRQAKTDEAVDVPCHARLLEEIRAAPGAITASPLLVASPRGKQWSYRNFARAWDRTRRRANWRLAREAIRVRGGLPKGRGRAEAKAVVRSAMLTDLQRRDLRRTGVVQLALAGATVPQIAALTGWKIDHAQKIVDTYLPRRGEVALGGVERWEADDGRVVVLAEKRAVAQAAKPARRGATRGSL